MESQLALLDNILAGASAVVNNLDDIDPQLLQGIQGASDLVETIQVGYQIFDAGKQLYQQLTGNAGNQQIPESVQGALQQAQQTVGGNNYGGANNYAVAQAIQQGANIVNGGPATNPDGTPIGQVGGVVANMQQTTQQQSAAMQGMQQIQQGLQQAQQAMQGGTCGNKPVDCYAKCRAEDEAKGKQCAELNKQHAARMKGMGCNGVVCTTPALGKTCSTRKRKKKDCGCS